MEAGRKPALPEPRDWGMKRVMLYLETASLAFFFLSLSNLFPNWHYLKIHLLVGSSVSTALLGIPESPDYRRGQKRSTSKGNGTRSPGGYLLPQRALAWCLRAVPEVVVLNPCTVCVLGMAYVTVQPLTTRDAGKGPGLFLRWLCNGASALGAEEKSLAL